MLAEALRSAGREEEANGEEAQLVRDGASSDPRTLALFLATRGREPEAALSLAQRELEAREDVFTFDALAWTLHARGRANEARAVMRRALAEGTTDARLFYHAGVIAAAANDRAEAPALARQGRRDSTNAPAFGASRARQVARRREDRNVTLAKGGNRFWEEKLRKGDLMIAQFKRLAAAVAVGSLALGSAPALGSSHMDAPLIVLDPAANTTDVYAFVDENGAQKTLSSRSVSIRSKSRASGRTSTTSTTTCSTRSTSPPGATSRRAARR